MMPSKSLQDFVKVYENHLPADLCRSACLNLDLVNWQTHQYYHPQTKQFVSYDHELSTSHDQIEESAEINRLVWYAIERYILHDFNKSWFDGWAGYTSVRFNRYDPSTQMKLHCDHIHSIFDGQRKGVPVLTVLGALNDDYEGGELMMFGDQQIHLPPGSVVVFPSNFLYPHEVRPIKSGVRYSYVSWTW